MRYRPFSETRKGNVGKSAAGVAVGAGKAVRWLEDEPVVQPAAPNPAQPAAADAPRRNPRRVNAARFFEASIDVLTLTRYPLTWYARAVERASTERSPPVCAPRVPRRRRGSSPDFGRRKHAVNSRTTAWP